MSTSKMSETPKAEAPAPAPKSSPADSKTRMVLTVFPKGATATEIAEALHKLAREHSQKS